MRDSIRVNTHKNTAEVRLLCAEKIAEKLKAMEAYLRSPAAQLPIRGDLQFACSHVIYKIRSKKSSELRYGKYFDKHHYRYASIDILCIPRTLEQKQILSTARQCEEQPFKYCHTDEYKAEIRAFRNTVFLRDYESDCLKD